MNPAHDTTNPPGQVDLRGNVLQQDKALSYMIDDFKRCSSGYAQECQHDWIPQDPNNPLSLSFCKKCHVTKRLDKV